MKKAILLTLCATIAIGALYFFGSGFIKVGSAYIGDYAVSDDGTVMTVTMGVASSIGYIRTVSVHPQADGILSFDCISAFGGINGSVGAANTFDLPLDQSTQVIRLYRDGGYAAVLEKDASGDWNRAA